VLLVEHHGLSAAVLDHALGDGDGSQLCAGLKERDIPFLSTAVANARVLRKSTSQQKAGELVTAMESLLEGAISD
jgi:IS5 family transposase